MLARAYAACETMARAHYENFPVASRLLPAAMRPHVAAVYAYARGAGDLADGGGAAGAAQCLAAPAPRRRRRGTFGRRAARARGLDRGRARPFDSCARSAD